MCSWSAVPPGLSGSLAPSSVTAGATISGFAASRSSNGASEGLTTANPKWKR